MSDDGFRVSSINLNIDKHPPMMSVKYRPEREIPWTVGDGSYTASADIHVHMLPLAMFLSVEVAQELFDGLAVALTQAQWHADAQAEDAEQ